jgi:hypothetical protein
MRPQYQYPSRSDIESPKPIRARKPGQLDCVSYSAVNEMQISPCIILYIFITSFNDDEVFRQDKVKASSLVRLLPAPPSRLHVPEVHGKAEERIKLHGRKKMRLSPKLSLARKTPEDGVGYLYLKHVLCLTRIRLSD